GDDILVRVHNEVFRIAMADGTLRGRAIFVSDRTHGTFALAAPGAMITDVTDGSAETGALVWVAIDGKVTRRLELHGQVAGGSAVADSAELDVCLHRPGAGNHLVVVDRALGTIARSLQVPFGASSSARLERGWLVRNMAPADESSAGLYSIDERGA